MGSKKESEEGKSISSKSVHKSSFKEVENYATLLHKDFDFWKSYEDNVLLIMNEHSR